MLCYLQKTHFRSKDTNKLRVKKWEEMFQAHSNEKSTVMGILILDKIGFK